MCGISITRYKHLADRLDNQEYRGLDSLGIINLTHGTIYKCVRDTLKKYVKEINSQDNHDGLCIMHHRKASIGKIVLDNSHPFQGEKFTMMQNGTSRKFMNANSLRYGKDTDSETLLCYLEARCDNLTEVIKELEEIDDTLGIIIMVHVKTKQVLVYTDGARESWIKIQNGLLKEYSNYAENRMYGYKNEGYLIFDYTGKIISKEFKEPINSVSFNKKVYNQTYSYKPSNTTIPDRTDRNDGYRIPQQQSLPPIKKENDTCEDVSVMDSELFTSGLKISTVKVLMNNNITEYDEMFSCSEADLCFMDGITIKIIDEVKNLLTAWGMTLAQDTQDAFVDEFREEIRLKQEQDDADYLMAMAEEYGEAKPAKVIKPTTQVQVGKRGEEYFYSEEILGDDGLLFGDLLCYVYRSKPGTLKGYAYQCMGIPDTIAIKRVVGKATYKRMRKLFNAAVNKVAGTTTTT